ncbi:EthD domain-containing protein [Sphingobium tyrosinilyticum]|uniref:EthD domain-containing protein n=1 Tax=Sphingobium tyrosinilyticum TaxID=2715436 RepID=A0ABV9ETV8_9SPHN
MTKSICALAHKPGSTREAFQAYYEEHHVPLAIGHFPFSGYARNHLTGAADFRWDTISEFWADDIDAAAALMAGPIGKIMAEDEERFMNRPLIASAGVEEVILSRGNRAGSDGSRTAILVQGPAGGDDLRSRLMGWASGFARDLPGVSVDFTSSWTELAFPAKAVVWLPGWHEQCSVPSGLSAEILLVRHVETPRSRLLG